LDIAIPTNAETFMNPGPGSNQPVRWFKASLGKRERLFFYALGCGVFLGMPIVMGIMFSVGFGTLEPLALPLPFVMVFVLMLLFRPTGYRLDEKYISVTRPIGDKKFPITEVEEVRSGSEQPPGGTIGLARVDGLYGTFGTFWSRSWGKYHVYVTDAARIVQILFRVHRRLFVSPRDDEEFSRALEARIN
jgi:hypothetical protein